MPPPRPPLLAIAVILIAGCAAAAPTAPFPDSTPVAPPTRPPGAPPPPPTTSAAASAAASSAPSPVAAPSVASNAGLAVVRAGRDAVRATIADPAATSWPIVVAGTGSHAGDRWIIEVDTGDTGPVVSGSETINGHDGEVVELATLETGQATGRICATRLPVCLDAATFRLPHDDGTVAATLVATDPGVRLTITGGHATWSAEPFILGPWTSTDPEPWQG